MALGNETEQSHEHIVDVGWLSEHLKEDDIRVLDGTYFLADKTRNAREEYVNEHIPGARFFDITQIAELSSAWPNTIPDAATFSSAVNELGIENSHHVIAYDRLGLFSAARIWWMFRYFGHHRVSVLDGGLPAWKSAAMPLESGPVNCTKGDYRAIPDPTMFRSAEMVLEAARSGSEQIVDVRAVERFAGTAPEPYAGLRSGHIPDSLNLPFQALLDDQGRFKSVEEISSLFEQAGVRLDQPIVTSCGSGVTACIATLALTLVGHTDNAVFDGSWSEWGSRHELPVSIGSDK